jgi:hypothetical protein
MYSLSERAVVELRDRYMPPERNAIVSHLGVLAMRISGVRVGLDYVLYHSKSMV